MLALHVTTVLTVGPVLKQSSKFHAYFGGVCWKGSLV